MPIRFVLIVSRSFQHKIIQILELKGLTFYKTKRMELSAEEGLILLTVAVDIPVHGLCVIVFRYDTSEIWHIDIGKRMPHT